MEEMNFDKMRNQIAIPKTKLDKQEIVTGRMVNYVICGLFVIVWLPLSFHHNFNNSWAFVIGTDVIMLYCIVRELLLKRHQRKLNKRLSGALDKAEAANKAKSIFLKNMTHEIHTPINQIYGFAQIMADRSIPLDEATIREMCDAICESSAHLTKLADNIVEVADKVSDLDDLETGESVIK